MLRKQCEQCNDGSCPQCRKRAENRRKAARTRERTRARKAARNNISQESGEQNMVKAISTSKVRVDGGTQPRASMNEDIVQEYAESMQEGAKFPPITVYFDGTNYWLADGFHRYWATQKLKRTSIGADVREGTLRDAILHSVGANGRHGLRRSNVDKRKAVETLLKDEEWSQKSDRWIADQCGVSNRFASTLRSELTVNGSQSNERLGRDGRVINTANIGHSQSMGESPSMGETSAAESDDPATFDPDPYADQEPEENDTNDSTLETQTDGYGRPVNAATSPERDPGGVYVETTTEVMNADLPAETKPQTLDDLTQAEEDALTDDQWLAMLPLGNKLTAESMDARLFTEAALNWRRMRKLYLALRREVKANVNEHAPDMYSSHMRSAVTIAHPKSWRFSRGAAGGFLLW